MKIRSRLTVVFRKSVHSLIIILFTLLVSSGMCIQLLIHIFKPKVPIFL